MEYNSILANMPTSIHGYSVECQDDYYTIVLNANLSSEMQMQAYFHEVEHINNNDFSRKCSADIIEFNSHKR